MDSLKKTISVFGIIAFLIIVMASLVACSSSSTTTSKIDTPSTTFPLNTPATSQVNTPSTTFPLNTPSTTSKAPTTTTSGQASGGALADILGRVAGIASMKYDMVTTSANVNTTGTVWVKKTKMRMETTEQGQNVVILINGDTKTMYLYTPAQNSAIKMDFSQAPESASADANSILQYNPTILGTETLDGKVCTVIQYTANGATSKVWLWQDKGLPVRMQTTTSSGTTTIDFKNYDFSDVPDSQFDLPAGAQISTFNLPTGLPTGLPSGLPSGFPTNLPIGP